MRCRPLLIAALPLVIAITPTTAVARGGHASATAAARYVQPMPAHLRHLADSRQILIVQLSGINADHGILQGWQRGRDGRWRQEIATQPANVGRDGLVPGSTRAEGDLRTPEGTYTLTFAFGILINPGSGLPYTQLTADDYWAGDPADPATYNLFEPVHPPSAAWSVANAEHLLNQWPAYRYAVNIDWNTPADVRIAPDGERLARRPANVRAGYAIFLHSFGASGPNGYTLGCVAVSPGGLLHVLRWLNPHLHPRIVIGTTADITRQ